MIDRDIPLLKLLLKSEVWYHLILNNKGVILFANAAILKLLGNPKIVSGQYLFRDVIDDASNREVENIFQHPEAATATIHEIQLTHVAEDNQKISIDWTYTTTQNNENSEFYFLGLRSNPLDQKINKIAQPDYTQIFESSPVPTWIYDRTTLKFLEVNDIAIKLYGYTRKEFLSMTIKDIRPVEDLPLFLEHITAMELSPAKNYWRHLTKDGTSKDVQINSRPINFNGTSATLVVVHDITEQVRAEKKLIRVKERYHYAGQAAFDAIWDWNLISNKIEWTEGYEKLFGYKSDYNSSPIASWYDHIHPKDRKRIIDSVYKAINSNESKWQEEYRYLKIDGEVCYILNRAVIIKDEKDQPCRMIGAMQDYTEREKTEQSLKTLNASLAKRASELASSNEELERFAYVASHDLQEPLRMVSSFLQLLQKRYKEKLDAKANEYIHFAVDGAERMKTLILDLLKFSRVNTSVEQYEMVDLNEICSNVLFTYKQRIDEAKATISIAELPTILGNKTELVQLFQNLLGNAIKYRSSNAPLIKVDVQQEKDHWKFSIEDNGIGIDTRFFTKIFVIFQRLHHKNEYSGTGIGLAICKKIVERHGGRIWVNSTAGEGSTFYFTLPKLFNELGIQPLKTDPV